MSVAENDRLSLFLLLSLLLFMLLTPFLGGHILGEFLLLVAMYVAIISTIIQLHGKKTLRWLAIVIAVPFMCIEMAGLFFPTHRSWALDYSLLGAFFAFASAGLFAYLGKPGAITSGRIYASVSLYLMIATFWYSLYNVIEAIHPGSFVETGGVAMPTVGRSGFLYFSIITLTTVGYGDIVPVTPLARILASLEGAMGVLYIAITVARLVAAYQIAESQRVQ